MRKAVLLYGLLGGALIALLQTVEYRYLVVEHSIEIYGGLVALIFVTVGIWLGLRITGRKERVVVREVSVSAPFTRNEEEVAATKAVQKGKQLGLIP